MTGVRRPLQLWFGLQSSWNRTLTRPGVILDIADGNKKVLSRICLVKETCVLCPID